MCEGDDYEPSLAEEWFRAKKEHQCYACREAIRPGDRYHSTVQINDKRLDVFKHCARCWAMVQAILEAGAESVQWNLRCGKSWEEEFGDPPDDVAALAFMVPDEYGRLVTEEVDE